MKSLTFHSVCPSVYCLLLQVHLLSSQNYFPHFASASSTNEAEALLKWKTSLLNQTSHNNQLKDWIYLPKSTDTNATNSSSNPKTNGSPCIWTGISCNAAGSVTNITITSCGIQGQGEQGSVYKATLSIADTVAVKKLHLFGDDDKNIQKEFLNEIKALTEIRHRNIVKLYGFCSHRRYSFLVYEYLEKGSLARVLSKDEEAEELGWSKRLNIVKGVAHALCYMHHDCLPPIVHRDISSKNILLDAEYGPVFQTSALLSS